MSTQSYLVTRFKEHNPDEELPNNFGKKWTNEEEEILLEELSHEDFDIEEISRTHKRTVGGIVGRQKTIAYRLYTQNAKIDEIALITRLTDEEVNDAIEQSDNRIAARRMKKELKYKDDHITILKSEIQMMREDIRALNISINELKRSVFKV